ncbi:hypothetical protein NOC27_840 [Nitrosococcus oceani AFC27]|nr:hypothetical protein NOC27_840 [Nitrosococcus oceani AFC27]
MLTKVNINIIFRIGPSTASAPEVAASFRSGPKVAIAI